MELIPKITPVLQQAFPAGVHDAIAYLRSSTHEDARKFLEQYDELPPTSREKLPIEAFCKASSISPTRVLELIVTSAYEVCNSSAELIAAVAHPQIVQATVASALHPLGHQDRKMMLQRRGFVPAPKNQTVIMGAGSTMNANSNNTTNSNNNVNSGTVNQTEYHPNEISNIDRRMAKIGDRFNQKVAKQLPLLEAPVEESLVEESVEEVMEVASAAWE